jgi:hypothetical protein
MRSDRFFAAAKERLTEKTSMLAASPQSKILVQHVHKSSSNPKGIEIAGANHAWT